MKLLEQLLNEMGADTMQAITLVPGHCCYLKSVKSVLEFSEQKIELRVGKRHITVEGDGMQIGEYFEGDILIKGAVRGIKID